MSEPGAVPRSPAAVVVLVEGRSDAAVVEHLLTARGVPGVPGVSGVSGVSVVAMGGITNIERTLTRLAAGEQAQVCGLCDAAEVRFVERALRRLGRPAAGREALAGAGFFVCDRDLEDELIRALGTEEVETGLDDLGELGAFRTFQHQPEWRGRAAADQLRRFAGSGSGRKLRLAQSLVRRLTPATTPPPLADLVRHVADAVAG